MARISDLQGILVLGHAAPAPPATKEIELGERDRSRFVNECSNAAATATVSNPATGPADLQELQSG
jgi:hypothetical protein